jgi:hypothetical protein
VSVFVIECHLLDDLRDILLAVLTNKMPQYARDLAGNLFILFFIIFGHRGFKVEREYMINVFNGLIND